MKFSSVALLGAAGLALAQPHNHQHRHPARAHKVQRDVVSVTTVVPGPVETVWILNGKAIPSDEVQEGIKKGKYVVVGGNELSEAQQTSVDAVVTPAFAAPAASDAPAPSSSSAVKPAAAQFIEISSSSSSSSVAPTTTSTSSSIVPSSSSAASSSSAKASSSSVATTPVSSGGDWADFPSGTIPCSTFPSAYGPISVDYLGLEGWIGIQSVPGYSTSASSIVHIDTVISGGCVKNSFCSYACPAGYQKSQWPTAQGSTGQSIGGLYCNANGKLELSQSSQPQLCIKGAGGIYVENKLEKTVSVCRTDYPGLESETVPLAATTGGKFELTCPDASSYYTWEGLPTSAQYYINPQGYSTSDACLWGTAGGNVGNWAPVNAGVGKGLDGTIYLSLIPNTPTNTYGHLDFTITITGDVTGKCSYSSGTYYNNGVASSSGCTVSVKAGGTASYVFS
ncbi:Secreted beta-glucosidase sun1 protein [Rutstroemia sp. NJR-2017a WRK4]|nr:Secreted beta-glucosidase sun1 protein [Rutstroemia sp. NJR-2017a WRK4]